MLSGLGPRNMKNFRLIFWSADFLKTDSFYKSSGQSPKNLQKLSVYRKCPHEEIRSKTLYFNAVELAKVQSSQTLQYILFVFVS